MESTTCMEISSLPRQSFRRWKLDHIVDSLLKVGIKPPKARLLIKEAMVAIVTSISKITWFCFDIHYVVGVYDFCQCFHNFNVILWNFLHLLRWSGFHIWYFMEGLFNFWIYFWIVSIWLYLEDLINFRWTISNICNVPHTLEDFVFVLY